MASHTSAADLFTWDFVTESVGTNALEAHAGTETNDTAIELTRLGASFLQASADIWLYGPPVLITIGTIGNGLSVAVMMRPTLRSSLTSFFLVILAFADTLVLYTGLLRYWVRVLSGKDIRDLSDFGCRFHLFLVYWAVDFAVWALTIVSVERFVAVCLPLQAKIFCTRRNAIISLGAIAGVLVFVNCHWLFTARLQVTYDPETNTTYNSCETLDHSKYFVSHIFPWIDFCMYCFIPFLLMITCNANIMATLVRAQLNRKRLLNTSTSQSSGSKMTSMTAILLTVSVVFLLTTAPISVYLIAQVLWTGQSNPNTEAKSVLAWAVVNILAYTNNAINFILYCVSGPRFRRELVAMFRRNKVHPATGDQSVTLDENDKGLKEGTAVTS